LGRWPNKWNKGETTGRRFLNIIYLNCDGFAMAVNLSPCVAVAHTRAMKANHLRLQASQRFTDVDGQGANGTS
jgi:hypothetical protein